MSFESFDNTPVEESKEGVIPLHTESIEKKKRSVKEIIERWMNIAGIVSVSFIAGSVVYNTTNEQIEYDRYIEDTLKPEDKEEFDRLNKVIVSYLGEDAIGEIRIADRKAYLQRKSAEFHKTELIGFEILGLNPKTVDVLFGGDLFPKGWMDNEVNKIELINEELEGARASYNDILDKVTFYIKSNGFSENITPQQKAEYIKAILGHEIGHANAWDTDTELDMMGRIKLLYSVLVIFDQKYKLDDLSKEELKRHVNEYWSELCMQYFYNPTEFKKLEPEEFDLVNNHVLSQDPSFNVFEKAGPYFDEQGNPTQKILDLVK